MLSNKRHFFYNLLTSYGNTIIGIFLGLISVPIALNYWGKELYGIWTILTSFSTYITASGLGIDTATGNLMTKNSDIRVKVCILKKGVKLLIGSSIFVLCIIIILSFFVPDWLRIIGKMDEANYPIAKISAFIFITGIIINLPLSAVSNSLQAFGKAYIGTMITTLQTVLTFSSIAITVALKLSLPFYVLLVQVITIFCSFIKLVFVVFTIKKELPRSTSVISSISQDDNHYKVILKTGINMSLYGIAFLLVPNLSNLIISNNLEVKALVPYSLSYRMFSLVILFVTNMNIALAPLYGKAYGEKNWEWLNATYKKSFYTSVTLSAFLVLGVVWFTKPFIRLWTGSFDNYGGNFISILLGIYFFISALSNINQVVINSFNYTSKVWLISWTDGFIFLMTSLILIKKIGVVSVPLGLCVGACVVSSWAYPFIVYQRTEKRFKYDFKYLIKIIAIIICSIITYIFISNLNFPFVLVTFLEILGMGGTSLGLFLILPGELKNALFSVLKKKLGGNKDDNK